MAVPKTPQVILWCFWRGRWIKPNFQKTQRPRQKHPTIIWKVVLEKIWVFWKFVLIQRPRQKLPNRVGGFWRGFLIRKFCRWGVFGAATLYINKKYENKMRKQIPFLFLGHKNRIYKILFKKSIYRPRQYKPWRMRLGWFLRVLGPTFPGKFNPWRVLPAFLKVSQKGRVKMYTQKIQKERAQKPFTFVFRGTKTAFLVQKKYFST